MSDPAPGTGTTFDPNETQETKKPQRLSPSSVEAGIQQPSGEAQNRPTVVQQISVEEAEKDLDELGVDDWVKKHYVKGDFNIQSMANVLRETTEDIYNRLHAYGFELPEGTYSADL